MRQNTTRQAGVNQPGVQGECVESVPFLWRRRALAVTFRAALTAAFRTWRTQFIRSQLAIAVFVQRAERGGGVVDFICVNHAVMIRVERGDDRRRGRTMPAHSRPALSGLARLIT